MSQGGIDLGKDLKGKELGKNISQRKDGRYEARAVINHRKIDLYDTDIKRLLKTFEEEKARVLRDEYGLRPKLTLDSWYREWFEKCKAGQLKSDASRRAYDRKVRNTIVRELGGKQLKDISQLNIQEACNRLVEEGYRDRTVREGLGAFRECMDSAVANRIISRNPCVGIRVRNSNVMTERRVLSKEEEKIFLDEIKGTYYEEVYKILLLTGMRIGEFSGLQWQDVDFEKKVIHIRRSLQSSYYHGIKTEELTSPKTINSYRDIPFFNETEECFKRWKEKQDSYREKLGSRWRADPKLGDLVFTSTMGSPLTRYVIIHNLNRIVDNINLKEMTKGYSDGYAPKVFGHLYPHAFRHTFATRCFEKGLNPAFVQSIMGHADYETTLSYTHIPRYR